jgi:hypothetical protein
MLQSLPPRRGRSDGATEYRATWRLRNSRKGRRWHTSSYRCWAMQLIGGAFDLVNRTGIDSVFLQVGNRVYEATYHLWPSQPHRYWFSFLGGRQSSVWRYLVLMVPAMCTVLFNMMKIRFLTGEKLLDISVWTANHFLQFKWFFWWKQTNKISTKHF